MVILIISLWTILFLTIPISLLLVAGNSYGSTENWKIVGKLLISFLVYLAASIFTFIFSVVIVVETETRLAQKMPAAQQIIALSSIYLFLLIGYLLCSFINGSFFKPWKISFLDSKKPQTIFDKK